MEELLRKDDNGKDEISEKFLRLNGRYITDGQVKALYCQSFHVFSFCLHPTK